MSSGGRCPRSRRAGPWLPRRTAMSGHGEGFFEDARGDGSEVEGFELVFGGPGDVGDVAAGAGFAGNAFAEVIHNHKVVARASVVFSRLAEDAFKDLDQFEDADAQAGFLFEFAAGAFFERLAGFESAARDGPLAFERFAAAADEERASVLDDDAADAHDGA